MEDPANQINGIVIIEDLKDFSFSVMSKVRAQDPDSLAMKWMQVWPRAHRGRRRPLPPSPPRGPLQAMPLADRNASRAV